MTSSGSEAMHSNVRNLVEPALGADLSGVRVHSDSHSQAAARGLGARAFTWGYDIYLGAGEHAQDIPLMAHEATHVAQQTAGGSVQPVIQRAPLPGQTETVEERRQLFEDRVLKAAVQRLWQNQLNLGKWRRVIERELSARELQRQASATTTFDLAQTAFEHQALGTFDAWANSSNPFMRNVYEHQMHGEWRACTGCHMAVQGSSRAADVPHIGPAWQPPWQTLSGMADEQGGRLTDAKRDEIVHSFVQSSDCAGVRGAPQLQQQASAPAAMIQRDIAPAASTAAPAAASAPAGPQYPFSPGAATALQSARQLESILAPLGQHGYRIIPPDTMSLLGNASPEELRTAILDKIDFRNREYGMLIARIEAGKVSYLDLTPVLNDMLPNADAEVRAAVAIEEEHRGLLHVLEGLFTAILTLLTPLFPPLIFVTGPLMFHQGYRSYQEGYNYYLGQGANNVFLPSQQDAAGGLMVTGIMNMAMASHAMATGTVPALDWSATRIAVISDVNIAKQLVARSALGPIPAEEVGALMRPGALGRASHGYLDMRGMQILYRGQGMPTDSILSPLAREQGMPASLSMEEALQAAGQSRLEIAGYTARYSGDPVKAYDAPPGMADQPLGGAGIPTTRNVSVASHFAQSSPGGQPTIYVLRVPKGTAIDVSSVGWGQQSLVESEWVMMHEINGQYVVKTLPGDIVAPLKSQWGDAWSLVQP